MRKYKANRPGKKCRDHTGREFNSVKAMAEAWGFPADTVADRLRKGWPVERALTTPFHGKFRRVVDPESGYVYPSISECARATGLSVATIFTRRRTGRADLAGYAGRLNSTPARDHTGREYDSIAAMAAAWGIPRHTVYTRLLRDWPLERALTTPVKKYTERNKKS